MRAAGLAVALAALAGCAGAPVERTWDPVVAGTRYAGRPIELGAVKLRLALREGGAPENLRLSLGFLAANSARVVLSRAALSYGGKAAEWVTRQQAPGSADACAVDGGQALATDYWFNAAVASNPWSCVTLGFVAPGRRAEDALELRVESLSVDGEIVRMLPVSFSPRAAE
jgi:hypothetical protein